MFVRLMGVALILTVFSASLWSQYPESSKRAHAVSTIREVHLVNVNQASVDEQHRISASLVGLCFSRNNENEVRERLRDGFQRIGFFKASVDSIRVEPVGAGTSPHAVSVTARIEEGARYRLAEIRFTGNKVIRNTTFLRNMFPLKDGDIFNIDKVRKGLGNLREIYGELGYMNFTAVPETKIDEQKKLIGVTIGLEEGAAFYIKSISITGADDRQEAALRAVLSSLLRPGDVYNARLVKLFFARAHGLLPPGASPDRNLYISHSNKEHTVDIVVNVRPNKDEH